VKRILFLTALGIALGFGQSALAESVLINETDADQVSEDSAEFVELYDGGVGNTSLTGLALVFFNGSDDASYLAFDLDGQSTDGDGYFVLCGNSGTVANCDLDVSPDTNLIQNGADAVALFAGNAADFPNDTPLTTTGLLDAIVYDTNDSDDAGLLPLLNAAQPQVNEGGGGNSTVHSNQRCANGSGGARNTDTYSQNLPSPGEENNCGDADEVSIDIKPGSDPNAINPASRGVIPVAILTTDSFYALQVDVTTLAFGPGGAAIAHEQGHVEDVDGDEDMDLLVHFRALETGIACGDTEATLTGETFGGEPIAGLDAIKTVGKDCDF
jgi:hypothetical protein